MGKFLSVTAVVGLMVAQAGCSFDGKTVKGSGVEATEARAVQSFSKVSSAGSMDVNIVIGPEQSVRVIGDDNIVPLIETRIVGDELRIRPTESIASKTDTRVEIVVPRLSRASLAGSGDITIQGLNEASFGLSIAGSGQVVAAGTAGDLSTNVAGSGSMHLDKLVAKTARVSVSGSGDVDVFATESLQVAIAGSGDVAYAGAPKQLNSKISGSGSIRQKQ